MYNSQNNFKIDRTLESIPFSELAELCQASSPEGRDGIIKQWIKDNKLVFKNWLYPQLQAKIGRWTLSRHQDGGFCAFQLLKDNCRNTFDRGIYYFVTSNERALAKQYPKESAYYSTLVPFILMSIRKHQGVKYSQWSRDRLHILFHSRLWEAATRPYYPYSREDLLKFREIGLTLKSGEHMGTVKSPVFTYGLNGLPKEWEIEDGTAVEGPGALPAIARMMLCQTWCCHPQNRNEYMILDPLDWDRIPEPLLTQEVQEAKVKETIKLDSALPWD